MIISKYSIFLLLLTIKVFSFFSCSNKTLLPDKNIQEYIFLGHIYDWQSPEGDKIDPRVENLDLEMYEQIWLGGDICSATTLKTSTLTYLDTQLRVSSSSTLWAVGNHDIRQNNIQYISNVTGRPLYYTQYKDNMTTMVLNTVTDFPVYGDSCSYKEGQYKMIESVLDTITTSSHLILLMHNVVWSGVEPDMHAIEAANAWAEGHRFLCQDTTRFVQFIFPRLLEIQERGIQVVVISGDGGQFGKKYKYTSSSGIEFYISGINNSHIGPTPSYCPKPFNKNPDSILIFQHNLKEKTLVGKFIEL